jgi:hypothetical protein
MPLSPPHLAVAARRAGRVPLGTPGQAGRDESRPADLGCQAWPGSGRVWQLQGRLRVLQPRIVLPQCLIANPLICLRSFPLVPSPAFPNSPSRDRRTEKPLRRQCPPSCTAWPGCALSRCALLRAAAAGSGGAPGAQGRSQGLRARGAGANMPFELLILVVLGRGGCSCPRG